MKVYKKVIWLVKRLSVMGWREVGHRLFELFIIYVAKLPVNNRAKLNYESNVNLIDQNELLTFAVFARNLHWQDLEDDKLNLLSNNYRTLSFNWQFTGDNSWFRCPSIGFNWSRDFFHNINYRSGGKGGDVRIVWEASRLQQLVALAHIADIDPGNAKKAVQCYLLQFNSWYRNNPPYNGPHYISVMECALRIISLCFASSLLRDKIADDSYWIKQSNLITSHAEIILERLSLHSSSGNHTLTEAVGLIFAGKFYSNHPRASKWLKVGNSLFVDEFLRQTNQDGSGIEQTSWYLKFIFELAIVALPLLDSADQEIVQERVDCVRNFLSKLVVDSQFLSYGDSDNGFAVSRYLDFIRNSVRDKHQTGNFEDAGLIKITHGSTVVFFDYGNLGMSPSYGHGHADCLSVIFYYKGRCVLGDRGTYAYNSDDKLRRYFRSTAAHNTVSINQLDQSTQSTQFMWKNDILSELVLFTSNSEGSYALARHYGYAERFNSIHWRGIFVSVGGTLYVWDYVEGNPNLIEGYWHFDPSVIAEGNNIVHDNFKLLIEGMPESSLSYFDCPDVPIGVTSDEYGALRPALTIKTVLSSGLGHLTVFSENNELTTSANKVNLFFQAEIQKHL